MSHPSTPDAFWARVDIHPSGCWEWQGARWQGYGELSFQGVRWKAHRLAWTLARGPIPAGFVICHHCDNPPCVRPSHLFLGTVADNMEDRARKGRTAYGSALINAKWHANVRRGEQKAGAKLTYRIVQDIRQRNASGESLRSIATSLNVSMPTVRLAAIGITWKHVV